MKIYFINENIFIIVCNYSYLIFTTLLLFSVKLVKLDCFDLEQTKISYIFNIEGVPRLYKAKTASTLISTDIYRQWRKS